MSDNKFWSLEQINAPKEPQQTPPQESGETKVETPQPEPTETPTEEPQKVDTPEGGSPKQEQPTPNIWEVVKEKSGGRIDSEQGLQDVLSNFEQKQQELEDLRQKAEQSPFANDRVKKLNELYASGASEEQIAQFVKLQSIDVENVDAVEAKKLRYMHEFGLSDKDALQAVYDDYPLNDDDLEDSEKGRIKRKLERETKADKEFLKNLRVEVAKPNDTKNKEQELQRQQYEQAVDGWLPSALDGLDGIEKVNTNGKDGDDALYFDFTFDNTFKSKIPEMAKRFVMTNGLDTSDPQAKEAVQNFVKAAYFAENGQKAIQVAVTDAISKRDEYWLNRYNLPNDRKPDNPGSGDADPTRQYFDGIISGGKKRKVFK